MDTKKAKDLFDRAKKYCEEHHAEDLERAADTDRVTFEDLSDKEFLEAYCHVAYVSGIQAKTIKERFPKLRKAFKDFDLDALSKMRSIEPALKVINLESKANGFRKGCKLIADEGFPEFKKRLKEEGVDMLEELGYIGKTNKLHLAKLIGLADVIKPDDRFDRAAKYCDAEVNELVEFLCKEYSLTRNEVDVILWLDVAYRGKVPYFNFKGKPRT